MDWVMFFFFCGRECVCVGGGGGEWGGGVIQERINHMPISWNLAGNQMGQNYNRFLVKGLNVRK